MAKFNEKTQWRYCLNIKKMDKENSRRPKCLITIDQWEQSVDAKTDQCYTILNNIMDKLASLKKKRIKKDMNQPWYDE